MRPLLVEMSIPGGTVLFPMAPPIGPVPSAITEWTPAKRVTKAIRLEVYMLVGLLVWFGCLARARCLAYKISY